MIKGGKPSPSRPSLAEWDMTTTLLAEAVDRLGVIPAAIRAAAGDAQAKAAKPYPRPVTALERIEDRRTWQRHNSLVDEVKAAQQRHATT